MYFSHVGLSPYPHFFLRLAATAGILVWPAKREGVSMVAIPPNLIGHRKRRLEMSVCARGDVCAGGDRLPKFFVQRLKGKRRAELLW